MAICAFTCKLFFYNVLGGDTSMVCSGHPQNIISLQSSIATKNILHCIIKRVAHVKNTCYIRWRNNNGIAFVCAIFARRKQLLFFPEIIPPFFHVMWFIAFIKQIVTHIIILLKPRDSFQPINIEKGIIQISKVYE